MNNKEKLQFLVDEHSVYGLTYSQIKNHLHTSHNIPKSTRIPPVSKRVKIALEQLRITGDFPAWIGKGRCLLAINGSEKPIEDHGFSEHELLLERKVSVFEEEFLKKFNLEPVKERVINDYETQHPTSFDRWFFSRMSYFDKRADFDLKQELIEKFNIENPSPYVLFESFINDISSEYHKDTTSLMSEICSQSPHAELNFFSNWFRGIKTTNIQISTDDIEDLMSSKQANECEHWKDISERKPIYIDIKNEVHGERYISGIASIPIGSDSIRYCAIIEWKGIDIQGTVQWQDSNMSKDEMIITFWGDSIDDEDLTNQEYQEAAAIAFRLYKSALNSYLSDAVVDTGSFTKYTNAELTGKAKSKAKKKAKRKSLFSFYKKALKKKLRTSTPTKRKGWSLDSLVGVRGHTRKQPYGKNRSKLKVIWIGPYTKGYGQQETMLDRHIIDSVSVPPKN